MLKIFLSHLYIDVIIEFLLMNTWVKHNGCTNSARFIPDEFATIFSIKSQYCACSYKG